MVDDGRRRRRRRRRRRVFGLVTIWTEMMRRGKKGWREESGKQTVATIVHRSAGEIFNNI